MAIHSVTYRSNTTHTAAQAAEIDGLNWREWNNADIERICENCKRLECRAELQDEHGFARGDVDSLGNYQLR